MSFKKIHFFGVPTFFLIDFICDSCNVLVKDSSFFSSLSVWCYLKTLGDLEQQGWTHENQS